MGNTAASEQADEKNPPLPGGYLELCLGKRTAVPPNLARSRRSSESSLEIIRVIEKAREDSHIRGLALNLSGFSAGRSCLWELRTSLESFKAPVPPASAGKKIVAYLSQGDLDLYCLVSVADKIVLDPAGSLSLLGCLYGRGFVRGALEKIGLGVRELRYLKYKSAQETFTREDLSDADREQYGAYLDDTFALTKTLLMKSRSWSEEDFNRILNDEYLYSAFRAREQGLVDYLGRGPELREAVQNLEGGQPKNWFRWGDPQFSLLEAGRRGNDALPRPYHVKDGGILRKVFGKKTEIALVHAQGQTDLERGMAARSLAALIREIPRRKAVKALVLRIESPGGSAEAADYIAQAINEVKEKIPVVVSMGSVAASGGYWAAMNASYIVASPYTLTGSIGVIAAWFFDKGLYGKLGLGVDLLSRGAHADLPAGVLIPRRDLSGEEEEQFRRLILDLYTDFVNRVAKGRNMSVPAVEAAAQGRVYSGLRAKDMGLVDRIGGLDEALRAARELAGIPQGRRVRYTEHPKPRFIDRIAARFGLPAPPVTAFPGLFWLYSLPYPESAGMLEDIRYRLSRNGEALPILPLFPGGVKER
ncbi:MAG: signal peptide peptidase SppA [Treponema sp.]|jgi:protease-4|nr:signal peptide peptidase SppA [Treponema sp.]